MIILAALSASACTNQKNLNSPTQSADTLIYYFRDAPMAPEYNRSYRIRVTPRQIFFSIESFDSILVKKSFKLSTAGYRSFVSAIDSLHLKSFRPARGPACIGSTSERLILYPGSSREVNGYISYCGGTSHGTLEGDIPAAAKLFKALIPDLDKRIETTEN